MYFRYPAGGAAVAVATLALGVPAGAHGTPAAGYDAVLKTQHHDVLATSTAFGKDCGEFGGSVGAGKEGWVFNVPSGQWDQAVGLKVVFTPTGGGGDVTILIKTGSSDAAAYPQGFAPAANPHNAFVQVPAGWTLKDGDGKTLGDQTQFLVTHTCLKSSNGTPTPGGSESPTPGTDQTPTATTTPGGDLPRTGLPVTGFVAAGLALVAGGAALMLVRRRRDIADEG